MKRETEDLSDIESREGDEAFERRARAVFDRSVEGLGAADLARLNRARMKALEAAQSRPWLPDWFAWRPTAAVASVIVAAFAGFALWQAGPDDVATTNLVADATDLEMLLSDDDLEMLEDLEFYAWLAEQPEFADDAAFDDGSG